MLGKNTVDLANRHGAIGILIGDDLTFVAHSNPDFVGKKLDDPEIPMSAMDGYEATRQIRGLYRGKAQTIPIIAMTANVFREDVEECLVARMNSHLGKPLNFEDVLDQLRTYFEIESTQWKILQNAETKSAG